MSAAAEAAVLHGTIKSNGNYGVRTANVHRAVAALLDALGVDLADENFSDTPRRFSEYLLEHFATQAEFDQQAAAHRERTFPSNYQGMLVEADIRTHGMCPHHLLPVVYTAAVAYLPNGRAIGLSKLNRITDLCTRLPILQEEATLLLAETLQRTLGSEDVAVVLRGEHMCMRIRGVKAHAGDVVTSELRGAFKDDSSTRAEALDLMRR